MLEVVISTDKKTLERQIKALKYALKNHTNPKDKSIHSQALERLESQLRRIK